MKTCFCPNCGASLNFDDEKRDFGFCQYCGARIMLDDYRSTHRIVDEARIREDETNRMIRMRELEIEERERAQARSDEERNNFKKSKWAKFLFAAFLMSFFIAFVCYSKSFTLSGILFTLQAICFIAAWLIGMSIIPIKNKSIHIFIAILGIFLIFPSLKSCNFSDTINPTENMPDTDWSIFFLGDIIPEPTSKKIKIDTNTENDLSLDILDTSEEEYYKYINECKKDGYINEMEEWSSLFSAYNDSGYYLYIDYYTSQNQMEIRLEAPTKLSDLNWETHKIAEILPSPSSLKGNFETENSETTHVIIGNTSKNDYEDYCLIIKGSGFIIDEDSQTEDYSAYNESGYKISLSYNAGKKEMSIDLDNPMEFSQLTWPRIGIGTLLPVPKSLSGKIGSDYEWAYSAYVENMSKEDFDEYIQECIEAGFDKDISNFGDSFWADYSDDISINVSYEGYNIVYIHISGSVNKDYSNYKK